MVLEATVVMLVEAVVATLLIEAGLFSVTVNRGILQEASSTVVLGFKGVVAALGVMASKVVLALDLEMLMMGLVTPAASAVMKVTAVTTLLAADCRVWKVDEMTEYRGIMASGINTVPNHTPVSHIPPIIYHCPLLLLHLHVTC